MHFLIELHITCTSGGINDRQKILSCPICVGTTYVFLQGGALAFQSILIELPTLIQENKNRLSAMYALDSTC